MKRVKRIAVAIPKYGLTGGAEGFAAQLTELMVQSEKYQIHVFANQWKSDNKAITFHKVPMITFPKFLTTVSFAYFANAMISKYNFDIIHTHDRIFRADIYTMHGIPHRIWVKEIRKKRSLSLFDRATAWVEKELVTTGACNAFLAVSSLTKEKLLQEYSFLNPEKIHVIHPGIELDRFVGLNKKLCRDKIRKRFNIGSDDLVILFASMNFDIRGLDHLIRALALIKSRNPGVKIKLLVVGKGKAKPYTALADSLGFGRDLIFTGILPKEEMTEVALAADIFSILSLFDTFSISVLEAMAASLPVIISENMGIKDLIKPGVNGYVVDCIENPDQVAEKIELLLDAFVREKMGMNAFETAKTQNWPFVAQKMDQIYKSILDKK
jgi:UDP-glucose:(heptosyl)LPS alpha-1,3-glucosyltransferase